MGTAARTVLRITQRSSRNDDARRHRAGFQRGVCCGQKNVFVQQWQKEFRDLWSDEQLARNVPMRVEFEQVYVFGTVAEAVSWAGGFGGDTGRGRNKRGWGRILRIDPLAPDDPIDPRRITCIHKDLLPSASVWRRAGRSSA